MSNDKKRPIEERIAALMGRSSFCDIRDGIGGTGAPTFTDQDVAAALGMVQSVKGKLACLVLETHYGSTLKHAETILRAWDDREYRPGRHRQDVVLTRFGGELAIRELASIRYGTPQLAQYAYLIYSRREELQRRMQDASRWLHGIRDDALRELRARARDTADERIQREHEVQDAA